MPTKVLFPRARNLENGWKLAQLPRDLGFPREHMAPGGSMSHGTPHGLWRRRRRMLTASIHGVLTGSCKLGMLPPSSQPRTLRGNWGPRRLTGSGPQSSAEQDKARSDWLRSPWPWPLSLRAVQGLKHRPRPLDDTQPLCLQPLHPHPAGSVLTHQMALDSSEGEEGHTSAAGTPGRTSGQAQHLPGAAVG